MVAKLTLFDLEAVSFLLPQLCRNVTREMAVVNRTLQNIPNTSAENCKDVDKILSVVVKRRRTVPTRCMEINKQICAYEILRLENAEIIIDEDKETEKFRKMIQEFGRLGSFQFTLHDLHEAEQRLEKYSKRIKEINTYLEKRKSFVK